MRIHFSNVNFSSRTGPNTFAARLAQGLTQQGHHVVPESEDYEIFLIFIEAASHYRPGAKIVQRLDGFWFKPDQVHTHHNRGIRRAYEAADRVVWQSEFDRTLVQKHWGKQSGQVIGNGIERKILPAYEKTGRLSGHPLFVCSANWHPQKRLRDNIRLFNHLRFSQPKAKLLVLGSVSEHCNREIHQEDLSSVTFLGNLTHEECLRVYSTADWMIHLAWLDHCPNTVVEALSQGCPVICTDAGGTQELVKRCGGHTLSDAPYDFSLVDYDTPPQVNIDRFVLPKRPQVDASSLDIDRVAKAYIDLFTEVTAS